MGMDDVGKKKTPYGSENGEKPTLGSSRLRKRTSLTPIATAVEDGDNGIIVNSLPIAATLAVNGHAMVGNFCI